MLRERDISKTARKADEKKRTLKVRLILCFTFLSSPHAHPRLFLYPQNPRHPLDYWKSTINDFFIWEREEERERCIWRVDKNIRHASQVLVFNKPGQAKCFQLNHAYVQFLTAIGSRVHCRWLLVSVWNVHIKKFSLCLKKSKNLRFFFFTHKRKNVLL